MNVSRSDIRAFKVFTAHPRSIDIISLTRNLDFNDKRIPEAFAKAFFIAEKNSLNHLAMRDAILVNTNGDNQNIYYPYCIKALAALLLAVEDKVYSPLKAFCDGGDDV